MWNKSDQVNAKMFLRLFLLGVFFESTAHAENKIYRIVVLSAGHPGSEIVGLRDGLREAGYVEGKNLVLSIPQNSSINELRAIMRAHKQEHVDVFITIGVTESVIARNIITDTP